MMDDRNISYGLTRLADDIDPPAVDVHAVIAAAKAQNRNRRLVGATAVGTMALVGALAVGVGGGFGQGTTGTTAAAQPTSVSETEPIPTDSIPVKVGKYDEQAQRLSEQLATLAGSYVRQGVEMSARPAGGTEYEEWGDRPDGAPLPFFFNYDGRNHSFTNLTAEDGPTGSMDIQVIKEETGLPVDRPANFAHGPCDPATMEDCTREELSDGTIAWVRTHSGTHVVFARRPDGTAIEVIAMVDTASTIDSLVDPAKLRTIVEAITY